jgi:hypothetical protein
MVHEEPRQLWAKLVAEWLTFNAQQYGEPITVSTDARGDLHLYALAEFDRRNAKSGAGQRYPQYLALERKYEVRVPNPRRSKIEKSTASALG